MEFLLTLFLDLVTGPPPHTPDWAWWLSLFPAYGKAVWLGLFKCCKDYGSKLPPSDRYSLFLLCLREVHCMDLCSHCMLFEAGKEESSGPTEGSFTYIGVDTSGSGGSTEFNSSHIDPDSLSGVRDGSTTSEVPGIRILDLTFSKEKGEGGSDQEIETQAWIIKSRPSDTKTRTCHEPHWCPPYPYCTFQFDISTPWYITVHLNNC